MKDVLTLIIDQTNFNEVMSGQKKEEYRSLSEYYINRFCNFHIVESKEEFKGIKPIKFIKLAVGYSKARKWAIFEVKGIFIDKFENFIPEGFAKGDECFTIELGKVMKHN